MAFPQTVKLKVTGARGVKGIQGDPGGAISDNLAASSGSSLVGFIQSGTGAASETAQTTLRRTVYASQYSTLQAAITANPGRDIILSPGTTDIGLITMSGDNTRIIGTRGTTLRRTAATAGNLFTITGANCALIGFVIDGNRSNQTYAYNVREVLVQAAKAEIRSLRVINAISHGIGAVGGATYATISDNDVETCGDFGIFVDNGAGGTDPAYGLCENNRVQDFGIDGGGSGVTTSVGIGVRSATGGWRIIGNFVRQTTSRTNDQLGIECWTNSANMVVAGNTVDMSTANSGEFGLSITSYGSIVSSNLVLGTSSYAIEVIDRAVTVIGNVLRSPTGIGIGVNLNSGHTDPGDIITISGNSIENTSLTSGTNGGIVIAGDAGVTPISITISGNTVHGLSHGIVVTSLVTGYTITGNTTYNTGSGQSGILPLGTNGNIAGNTVIRVSSAGTGNAGGIIVGGVGNFVATNRIAGNSRIDNAILINSGTTDCVVMGNFITGASNAVFSSATASSVVVRDNIATSGVALQSANRAAGNLNTANDSVTSQLLPLNLGVFTVGTLPSSSVATGTTAFVTDANATTFNSVVAGGGSNGVPVTWNGTNWRIG